MANSLPALLASVVDAMTDVVEIVDADHKLIYVNKQFERTMGWTLAEVLGRSSMALMRNDAHDAEFYAEINDRLMSGRSWVGNLTSRTKDGVLLEHSATISPMLGDDGEICGVMAIKRATNAHHELERQLRRSERLAAVGQLAAGVAHEVNNPLTYILANLNFLKEEVGRLKGRVARARVQDMTSLIDDAHEGATRVRDIVRSLRAFARDDAGQILDVDVRASLDQSLDMVRNQIRFRARLVRDYQEVPRVMVNEAQLGQVFLNLLLNAAQSIEPGNTRDNLIVVAVNHDEESVRVSITDSGHGIPAEIRDRIFDPFFTTKDIGEGTGLGLPLVHNMVGRWGGYITVDSEVGQGTTMTVVLPVVVDDPETDTSSSNHASRTILVIDDIAPVARAIGRLFRDDKVTTQTSGLDALELLRTGTYDVVICDLMMPDLSGMELYAAVLAENPNQAARFVFVTGGAFNVDAEIFAASPPGPLLEKPLDPYELRRAVDGVSATLATVDAINRRLTPRHSK